jgi:hypothetical protein
MATSFALSMEQDFNGVCCYPLLASLLKSAVLQLCAGAEITILILSGS